MKRIKKLVNISVFNTLSFICIVVYEFGSNSLINVRPFNYIFNFVLILWFVLSAFRFILFKEFKQVSVGIFKKTYLIIFAIFVCFLISDIVNSTIPINSVVLPFVLFSSFSLCSYDRKYIKRFCYWVPISIAFGLALIFLINIKDEFASKTIISMPFLNLDSFASNARNALSLSLLFLIFSKDKIIKKIPLFIVSISMAAFMVLSFRIGSIIIFVFCFMILFGFLIYKKNKFLLLFYVFFIIIAIFLAFILLKDTKTMSRIIMSINQLFSLDYSLDGSTRSRTVMLIRDFISSGKTILFGYGYNGSFNYNAVLGHNSFGSIVFSYGLMSYCFYLTLSILPLKMIKGKSYESLILYFLLFNLIVQIFDTIYGMGSFSRTNYIELGVAFSVCVLSEALPDEKLLTITI